LELLGVFLEAITEYEKKILSLFQLKNRCNISREVKIIPVLLIKAKLGEA
jgi:hypothetical protein